MTWQATLTALAALLLAALLLRRIIREREANARAPREFFEPVLPLMDNARIAASDSPGNFKLDGDYKGFPVQVQAITDTLALRRLPALWLLVTLPSPLPLRAKFDMMMRPAGQTTFSNFDLLLETIGRPPGFPEESIVKSDNATEALPAHVVVPHLNLFDGRRAKELLIAPNGLRIVWLLAEADRARYGVFRQADFGGVTLGPDLLSDLLDRLIMLRQSILDWHQETS
ncbi:MAG: hypothetical protein ACKVP5_21130 [Aestuariivirga sp.]